MYDFFDRSQFSNKIEQEQNSLYKSISKLIYVDTYYLLLRRGYNVSKRLVKLTMFQDFPSHLPGYQYLPPLWFVLSYQIWHIDWVLISAKSAEDCISVEKLNTLNTDLQ